MPEMLGFPGPHLATLLGEKLLDNAAYFDEHYTNPKTPDDKKKREQAILFLAIGDVIAENNRCIQEELKALGVLPPSFGDQPAS